jgi:LmbE family N-acetylglucosaminyl deacetylase
VPDTDGNLRKVAIAIAAHPDDIEFMMAGTLLLLNEVGWETHYLNISSGNCGSINLNSKQTETKRLEEAQKSATILGATFHPPFSRDLEIFYDSIHLRKLASVIRRVKPTIVLTHSPQDYMEDHTNTSRLAVTAAFSRGMPNFDVDPPLKPIRNEIALYHAMPHGLMDGMCQTVKPDLFINTTSVFKTKQQALSAHQSQKEWLDISQGMNSYLESMELISRKLGEAAGSTHAEGWRLHSHLGFSTCKIDPLSKALKHFAG